MAIMGDPHLTNLMDRYGFSIVEMQALDSGSSPWAQGAGGKVAFDSGGRWRHLALHIQREMMCEQCRESFAYTFQVVEEGGAHRGQHVLSVEALKRAVDRHLRHRIRCPHCQMIQQQPRRAFLRRDRRDSLIGVASIGGGLLGAGTCVMGGFALAGLWGLIVGAAAGTWLVIKLTQWMVAELLDEGY